MKLKRFASSLALALCVVVMGHGATVVALSTDQLNSLNEGAYYYNVSASDCADSDTGTLTGSDNIQKAYNFFVASPQSLTPQQSAGIVGNLMQESGVNPNSVSNGGQTIGIGQWEGGRDDALKRFAESKNVPYTDLMIQLQFLWSELPSQTSNDHLGELQAIMPSATASTNALEAVKASSTPEIAAQAYEYTFERAGTPVMSNRIRNAEEVFTTYGSSGGGGTSEFAVQCGAAVDTSNFIEYKQCDYNGKTVPWANAPYGNHTVCSDGCGPSAMAMIITNLTGQKVTPDMTAAYGAAHGTFNYGGGGGSTWTIAQTIGSHWGLQATDALGSDVQAINKVLQAGGMVLATGTGAEPFTTGGHFIVIRGLTSDGKWLTGNSAGFDSSKPYDPATLVANGNQLAPHFNAWGLTKK